MAGPQGTFLCSADHESGRIAISLDIKTASRHFGNSVEATFYNRGIFVSTKTHAGSAASWEPAPADRQGGLGYPRP
jgi:hypothetical protein